MDGACFRDYLRWIDWNTEIEFNDTNKSFDKFFTVVNDLLDTNAPYKKLSLRGLKLKTMVDERHINIYKSKK